MAQSEENAAMNADLVARTRAGEEEAWAELIRRYHPLVTKISYSYRLNADDVEDVRQMVWTRLFEHLDELREPRALPGWISTTTVRTCLRVVKQRRRSVQVDTTDMQLLDRVNLSTAWSRDDLAVDDDLLRQERRRAVRRGLAELTGTQQQLLLLLVADPPIPYAQISEQVGMPVGSIGPTRARLLRKLGGSRPIRQLHEDVAVEQLAVA